MGIFSEMTQNIITLNQFKMLYDLSDDFVFLMRKSGSLFIYECINKKAEELFHESPIGKSLDECFEDFHNITIIQNYNRALAERKTIVYTDLHCSSCETAINETTVIPIYDGDIEYILASTKEISRSQELKVSTYILESYKKGITSTALVAMANKEGRIEMVNQVFEDTSFYTKEELLGKRFNSIYTDIDAPALFQNILETVQLGNIWRGEIRNKTKYGSYYWVDANVIPIQNEHGEFEKFLTIQFDITEKKRVIDELRNIERTFSLITEYSNDLIAILDEEGRLLYSSLSHEKVLQYDKEELLGKQYLHLLSEEFADHPFPQIEENKVYRKELLVKTKKGHSIWTDTTITTAKREMDGQAEKCYIVVSREITEKRELEDKLKFMAYHDSLTGLPNRRSFLEDFSRAIKEVTSDYPHIGLIYIDGDDFKSVNDRFGHDVGDQFLANFAEKLQQSVNYEHNVYRIGGDEFIVIVDKMNDYTEGSSEKVQQIVQSIQETLQHGWTIDGYLFAPTSSIGISVFPHHGTTVDELMENADQALYIAKKRGKNNFIYTNAVQ